jgi:hypothetical protein
LVWSFDFNIYAVYGVQRLFCWWWQWLLLILWYFSLFQIAFDFFTRELKYVIYSSFYRRVLSCTSHVGLARAQTIWLQNPTRSIISPAYRIFFLFTPIVSPFYSHIIFLLTRSQLHGTHNYFATHKKSMIHFLLLYRHWR